MSSKNSNNVDSHYTDPIRDRRVQAGFIILLLLLLPIWPVSGWLWGIPVWALLALFTSVLTSVFIAWVTLAVWRDPEDSHPESRDD